MIDIKIVRQIQKFGKQFSVRFPTKFKKIRLTHNKLEARDFNRWLLVTYPSLCNKLKSLSGKRIGLEVVFPFIYKSHAFKCLECGTIVKGYNLSTNLPMEFCSTKCQNSSQITSQRRTDTIVDRYGVENAFQSKRLMKKARKTLQERYGVETNISQSAEIQEKIKTTSLRKRGTHNTKKFRAATKLCVGLGYLFKVAVLVKSSQHYNIYWFTNPTSEKDIWEELLIYHPHLIKSKDIIW